MPTDFFERQSVARRNTGWLVWMFALAVIAVVGSTFLVTWIAAAQLSTYEQLGAKNSLPPHLPWWAAAFSAMLILLGSLYKLNELRGGGTSVAERLGGERVYPNASDLVEQRLLNVVEEMALASGIPVPPVYFLKEEAGINAFAAGYSPSDAVIGVTRGCAETLSREELQGVIAHEFSHILNGDMRLNIRLIGVLHGILLLGLVGQILLRAAGHSGGGSRRKDGVVYILLIGLALMILGYIGTVFGNLIKAAVSRQREYLADASAVQFTRNPGGIGGALKKIGGLLTGSRIENENAAEASHMFFAEGIRVGLTSMLATHPPLGKRIMRIDPQWDGKFPQLAAAVASGSAFASEVAPLVAGATASAVGGRTGLPVELVEHASDQVGHPTEFHRAYAAELLERLPADVVQAAHEPYGARAVVFGLLLDRDASIRQQQLTKLANWARPDVVELTRVLLPQIEELDVRTRLPLIDMSLPALRAMSKPQYESFERAFRALIEADDRIALFEWCLYQVLLRHLRSQFEPIRPQPTLYYSLKRLGEPCAVLFSSLARVGHAPDQAAAAFAHAQQIIPEVSIAFLSADACGLTQLQPALNKLARVSAKQRQRLVDAAAASICADSHVTFREAELLRAICDMLDCPMPPLLPGQRVTPRTGATPISTHEPAES